MNAAGTNHLAAFERFSRTERLIGKEALARLWAAHIAVFGIGGVGSYVAEALVRAGIGTITLIDNDIICASNINRQLHATTATIGQIKVDAMRDRLLAINPAATVTAIRSFYLPGQNDELVSADYSYIVDAVDTVTAKIGLIMQAEKCGVPIISSMGTGNKLDPSAFKTADIYQTSVCPLARVMRRELKERGIKKLQVVYSTEQPQKIADTTDTIGSISFVPAAAGLIIAGEVVRRIINNEQNNK